MLDTTKYIDSLLEISQGYLEEKYRLESFNLTNFELCNFFLLDKAINNNLNLFIHIINKNLKAEVYLPLVLSCAITLLYRNINETSKSYDIGDILIRKSDNVYYEIIDKGKGGFWIKSKKRKVPKEYNSLDKIKRDYEYSPLNKLPGRKSTKGLEQYKKLIELIFNSTNYPLRFPKKAAIILEKNSFHEELKNKVWTDINLIDAIPYQWINRHGKTEKPNISMDPMLYLLPDYESFQEFILEEEKDVDFVIILGKNKYSERSFYRISRDIREGNIENVIIIGSEDLKKSIHFSYWNWTYPEISILNEVSLPCIDPVLIEKDEFIESIILFEDELSRIEKQYSIRLDSFKGLKKLLYALVLPGMDSKANRQIEYLTYIIKKVYSESIENELFGQNLNPIIETDGISAYIDNIFQNFSNNKIEPIKEMSFDNIIIPDRFADIWKEETEYPIISYSEFKKRLGRYTKIKKFVFLSLFGYEDDIIDTIINTFHKYLILSYPEEKTAIKNILKRYTDNLYNEFNSKSRIELTGIEFPYKAQSEEISDLIERISEESSYYSDKRSYYEYDDICYKIEFTNNEHIVISSSRSVIKEISHLRTKTKVMDLYIGDNIRIYSNMSKSMLDNIAKSQDEKSTFTEIEKHSRLWKTSLYDYMTKNQYTEEELFNKLKENQLSIRSIATIRKWIDHEDDVKFPQNKKDLYIISKVIDNPELENNLKDILDSRRKYNGIMIAIGRNLSDEIMGYIISHKKEKGSILRDLCDKDIELLVDTSAPLRTIKNIYITEESEDE